jgi:hypothetical protein
MSHATEMVTASNPCQRKEKCFEFIFVERFRAQPIGHQQSTAHCRRLSDMDKSFVSAYFRASAKPSHDRTRGQHCQCTRGGGYFKTDGATATTGCTDTENYTASRRNRTSRPVHRHFRINGLHNASAKASHSPISRRHSPHISCCHHGK